MLADDEARRGEARRGEARRGESAQPAMTLASGAPFYVDVLMRCIRKCRCVPVSWTGRVNTCGVKRVQYDAWNCRGVQVAAKRPLFYLVSRRSAL
jgi:hypothetical protein